MKKAWAALILVLCLAAAGCAGASPAPEQKQESTEASKQQGSNAEAAAQTGTEASDQTKSESADAQAGGTEASSTASATEASAGTKASSTASGTEANNTAAGTEASAAAGSEAGTASGTIPGLEYNADGSPIMPILEDTRSEEYKENTFTTLNGDEVTYNMNTRKIVCIFGSQDVVGFGIPLLAYEGSTEIEGYEPFYQGAQALLNTSPFSPEEVLSYEPELILVNQQMSHAQIEQLSKIAPTIPLYTDSTDFATRLAYIGEIFGLQDSAKLLTEYAEALRDNMVSQLKALGLSDKTLTIFTYMGAISIPPDRGWFMNTIIYDYAGIGRLPIVEEFMTNESGMAYEAISAERLREYEGDMVIYAGFGESTITSYVSENIGWQSLDAVREDRVGVIDITPYAQKGVILLENQYGQVLEALKVAGNIN